MNYIPLNIKTDYSFLNSLVTVNALVKKCIEYGISSVAVCDVNSMSSIMDFYLECKKNNIKPIIGVELEIDDFKVLLYAKNYNGYKELIRLTTIKQERQLNNSDLVKNNDIIAIVCYKYLNKYKTISNIYETYLGYLSLTERKELEKVSNNLVFVNEVLVLEQENLKYLGYVNLIRENKKINEYEQGLKQNCLLKNIDIPISDINNMNNISESCNVEFNFSNNLLPIYDSKNDMKKYLSDLTHKGLYKRLDGKITKEYNDRLEYELGIINDMGFTNYFLIVWDYIKYAKKSGILVGPGRGSAASSLVSYCLGIIDIDPIKYNLLFERFLNPGRVTMPDIDVDFEDEKRQDVINYCIDKYGKKRVAGIVTFQTMGAKAALRDVGRIFDTPIKLIDGLSLYVSTKQTLREIYEKNKDFKEYIKNNNLYDIYDIASKIEGLKRQRSIHASGVVISRIDLDEIMPLIKHDDSYITGYPANYLESMGLLKMDFLGITNLTLIARMIDKIRYEKNKDFSFNSIPFNDEKTIELFKNGDTLGIFQFESDGMKNFLKKLKPNSLEDIICANALFRPGPSMFIDKYIELRKTDNVKYIDPSLEGILKDTYGIIVYQEQILKIANIMAGYTLGEADILRSAMSKKKHQVLENEKPKFINGCIKNGHSKEIATEVYNNILKFSEYGFNRAHAVAYSIVAYKMAYIKANYPSYFYTEILNNQTSKLKEYIYECKKHNINIIKPNINLSTDTFLNKNNSIIYPLVGIKNIGINVSNYILKEREKSTFISLNDFVSRCYSSTVDKKVLENITYSGALDIFGKTRQTIINNLDLLINYANLTKEINKEYVDEPIIDEYEEYSSDFILEKELDIFGFYLGNHPVLKYKNESHIDIKSIRNYLNKDIKVIGLVEKVKEIETKNHDKMCFVEISDEEDRIDTTLFPKVYLLTGKINKNDIVEIYGKVERRYEKYQIIVNKIDILNK